MSNYVPYQRCPICLGEGRITGWTTSSNVFEQCPTCLGTRIIPMHATEPIVSIDFTDNNSPGQIKLEFTEPDLGYRDFFHHKEYLTEMEIAQKKQTSIPKIIDNFEPDTTCGDLKDDI